MLDATSITSFQLID